MASIIGQVPSTPPVIMYSPFRQMPVSPRNAQLVQMNHQPQQAQLLLNLPIRAETHSLNQILNPRQAQQQPPRQLLHQLIQPQHTKPANLTLSIPVSTNPINTYAVNPAQIQPAIILPSAKAVEPAHVLVVEPANQAIPVTLADSPPVPPAVRPMNLQLVLTADQTNPQIATITNEDLKNSLARSLEKGTITLNIVNQQDQNPNAAFLNLQNSQVKAQTPFILQVPLNTTNTSNTRDPNQVFDMQKFSSIKQSSLIARDLPSPPVPNLDYATLTRF